ncbi:sugar transporter [Klebsormidium nitens]|uniref:Sugar transporter n=1 Tax=Klebsormidium nitens TaxID=105231 RepID=A0A1Y1IR25_KLENI|nr:sugar transporter [Klebsormidium nitens]|eukprot:GAQ91216.1 sugar transporter [Klebsormidium nitens]
MAASPRTTKGTTAGAENEDVLAGRSGRVAGKAHDQAPLLEAGQGGERSSAAPSHSFTIVAVLIAALGPLYFGYSLGYTSPALPAIESQLELTTGQASFFGALVNIGAMMGSLSSGAVADAIGRKGVLAVAACPGVLGWLIIALAQDPLALYSGRLLCGFATGTFSFAVPIYIAEVSPSHLRGGLGAVNQLGITIGIVLVYALGMLIHWRTLAFIGVLPMGVLLLGLTVLPESPRWLAKNEYQARLVAALRQLRGAECDTRTEMQEIQEAARQSSAQPRATLRDLFKRDLTWPLVAGVGLMVLQQFSGVNAVMFYSGTIFRAAGVHSADAAAFTCGLLQVFMTGLAVWLMDKAGRRLLLMVSAGGMAVSSAALAYSFWLPPGSLAASYLAIASLLVYIAAFSLGMGAVPWIIMSEIFPVHVRGLAGSCATLVNWTASFTVTQTFQYLLLWSAPGAFLLYAVECVVTVFFVSYFVPETRGRTLEEIEASFKTL